MKKAGKKEDKKEKKEKEVKVRNTITSALHPDIRKLTLGQRAADALTKWAGSWVFILSFLVFLIIWILINGYFLLQYYNKTFDPYPFILLNLVLSCLAAIQAPIILMSQNRQTERDRIRAEYDYQVNRKAEREIRELRKQLNRIGDRIRR